MIVGDRGSAAWAFGSYGTKVKHAMELKLADNPTIEIVSEKAFLDALEKTNADALETLSEKQEEYKRIWSTARSVGRDFHGLTDGQKKAFDLVKEGKNVYLTGLAGTGKSYIVERIIEWAQTSGLNVITCAPTGIAALNVGGSTVHRVLCIRPGRTLEKDPHPFVPTDSPLSDCDLLILDEVSMCRMDVFDYLSAVLKIAGKIRKQKGKGLCQLLVVGDFCQLPPVITNEERRFLEENMATTLERRLRFKAANGRSGTSRKWNSARRSGKGMRTLLRLLMLADSATRMVRVG